MQTRSGRVYESSSSTTNRGGQAAAEVEDFNDVMVTRSGRVIRRPVNEYTDRSYVPGSGFVGADHYDRNFNGNEPANVVHEEDSEDDEYDYEDGFLVSDEESSEEDEEYPPVPRLERQNAFIYDRSGRPLPPPPLIDDDWSSDEEDLDITQIPLTPPPLLRQQATSPNLDIIGPPPRLERCVADTVVRHLFEDSEEEEDDETTVAYVEEEEDDFSDTESEFTESDEEEEDTEEDDFTDSEDDMPHLITDSEDEEEEYLPGE